MDAGNLLESMFQLEHNYVVPDILFAEELKEQHAHLIDYGIQILPLSSHSMARMMNLVQKYNTTGVSSNDLSTLALAEQENAPLLTGDQILKQVCIQEHREVHGTLWIVGKMIENTLISVEQAESSYQLMINDGSRLPQKLIKKQINNFKKKTE